MVGRYSAARPCCSLAQPTKCGLQTPTPVEVMIISRRAYPHMPASSPACARAGMPLHTDHANPTEPARTHGDSGGRPCVL